MTVNELIIVLQQFPPDFSVYVHTPSPTHHMGISPAALLTAQARGGVIVEDPLGKRSTTELVIGKFALSKSRLFTLAKPPSPHGEKNGR